MLEIDHPWSNEFSYTPWSKPHDLKNLANTPWSRPHVSHMWITSSDHQPPRGREGGRRSPWRRPLLHLISLLCVPLTKKFSFVECNQDLIQFSHFRLKPCKISVSTRCFHFIRSLAFENLVCAGRLVNGDFFYTSWQFHRSWLPRRGCI